MSMQFGTPCGLAGLGEDIPVIQYTPQEVADFSNEESYRLITSMDENQLQTNFAPGALEMLAAKSDQYTRGLGPSKPTSKNTLLYAIIGGSVLFIMMRR